MVDNNSTSRSDEEAKTPGPDFVLGSGGCKQPRMYTSSHLPNRAGMTLGMTDDMLALAENYVQPRLEYNEIGLDFLSDFMEELDN
ncbi:hypothetical protein EIP91_012105 [Steccherinum ochraceum]|uniref:Uncharacterized protein n=1 Tax=Steccherinum ochraceum TaxID=92696 RepID=A0A4V2MXR1_9APHY|nr:hypothetical protein EIP91_012105 [Steccherinum ochraceum]